MKSIGWIGCLALLAAGCEESSRAYTPSHGSSTTVVVVEEPPVVVEEGEPFEWLFGVQVADRLGIPIPGADVSVKMVGWTTSYAVGGRTARDGWVAFAETVYPAWSALIDVSKPGYETQSMLVSAGHPSMTFQLLAHYR